ncbi:unnamed protein product [Effrenium voratum]|nr:unnamed protein product [Effrenium voratum]
MDDAGGFLGKLDDCQKHELVGRALQALNGDQWDELLKAMTKERSAERAINFRDLSGHAVESGRIQGSSPLWAEGLRLRLPPFHTLFRAKQQILEKADGFLPKVESASRREVQFFAGNSMLPEHMLAAMLPEEVSMVFSVLPRCMPASRSSWGTEPGTSDFDIFDVGELSDASI